MKIPTTILITSLSLVPAWHHAQDLDAVEEAVVEESVEVLPTTEAERLLVLRQQLGAKDTVEGWLVTLPESVLFEFDKHEVLPSGMETLDDVADLIVLTGSPMVTVEGHTDNIGDSGYNLDLSLKRADAVKERLVLNEGLSGAEITAAGLGEQRPIAANQNEDGSDNADGRQLNRRVEVHIRRQDFQAEDGPDLRRTLPPVPAPEQ